MRRIQYTESILNIPFHRKTLAELEAGEWLNENCVTLEMQLKSCQHLCESITNRLSVVLEECDYYDQERRNAIHLAPARTQKGRQVTIPPEVDAILAKMMENAEKENEFLKATVQRLSRENADLKLQLKGLDGKASPASVYFENVDSLRKK